MADPKLVVKQSLDNSQFKKGLRDSQSASKQFANSVKSIGAAIGIAFSVGAVVSFTKESIKLAGELQGVKEAFDRIGNQSILDDLIKATRGTVSNLELMRNAVKASNFKIPLTELSKLFEFATKRAAQTGESVDYLVESIILGLGRKSPLILDNLGISAVELRKKLRGVGVESASVADITAAMGEIIDEEMVKMGAVSITSKQRFEQLAATMQNLKESFGAWLADPALNALLSKVNEFFSGMENKPELKLFNTSGVVNESKLVQMSITDVATELYKLNNDAQTYFENWKNSDGEQRSFWAGQYDIAKQNIEIVTQYLQNLNQSKTVESEINTELSEEQTLRTEILEQARQQELRERVINQLITERNLQQGNITKIDAAGVGSQLSDLTQKYYDLAVAQGLVNQTSSDVAVSMEDNADTISSAMGSIAGAMGDALSEFVKGEKSFSETAIDIIASIIKIVAGYLAQSVASSFAGGASVGGPAAPFTGAAAAAAAAGLFASVVPALMASGGTVPQGYPNDTYPALLTSGETVLPSPIPLSSGIGGGGRVDFIIKGENLYGTLKKQQSKENRYK